MRTADVLVVGAGFAGLSAARDLLDAGRETLVIESRGRVGGRAQTLKLEDGLWIDHGGQWIGPQQEQVTRLAGSMDVGTFPGWWPGASVFIADGERTVSDGERWPLGRLGKLDLGFAMRKLDRMSERVPLETPWRAP